MARSSRGAIAFALLLLLASVARAQDDDYGGDFTGGDYGSYDTGSYDTGSYDTGSSSAATSYTTSDESTPTGGTGASSDPWSGWGSDLMTGSTGSDAVLSQATGVNPDDLAGGQPSAWDPPALASSDSTGWPSANDGWTSPYGAATASASDPWASSTGSSLDGWTSQAPAANDGWTASAPANDGWSTPANDGWNTPTSTTPANDGWNSATASAAPADESAAPSLASRDTTSPTASPMGSTYVPSEQANQVVRLAGTATPAERTFLQQQFDALPVGAKDALAANGTQIITCRENVTDSIPAFAGQRTGDGRTFEQVGGVFAAGGGMPPTVAVCTTIGPDGTPQFTPLQGSQNLFGHEVGHGVSHALGNASQRPEFVTAIEADRSLARGGDARSQGVLNPYYASNSPFGTFNVGNNEAYAEGFARYLSNDASWPGTFQYFRAQPGFRR